ncbi:hypothetical protein UJ101_00278 [Flavobacteriaceae bacterium UJ101]|nr:hypothetical protein UJ101_00278 [Flavobacteriaceae bacterium UJ101]
MKIIFSIAFIVLFNTILAQASASIIAGVNLPEISMMDLSDNNTITLNAEIPNDAGKALDLQSVDNSKWINYTSAIVPGGTSRKIQASISAGSLPPGIELELGIGSYFGFGEGVLGISEGIVSLNTMPQTIINGIGGAYTGDGVNNGHQLNFRLSISDYAQLDYESVGSVEVTYTLTDN